MSPSTSTDTDATTDTDTGSTDEQRQFSRRQVLAAAGASGVLGGVAGVVLGPRLDVGSGLSGECGPTPLSTVRHPWPHPEADAARTGHVSETQQPSSLDPGWSVEHELGRFHAPLVADGTILLSEQWDGDKGGRFLAFDPEDGTERWRTGHRPYYPETANIAGDTVFALREDGFGALALDDGSDRWHASDAPGATKRGRVQWSFVRDGRAVSVGPGDDGTEIGAFDGRTGDECGSWNVPYDDLYGPAVSGTQAFFKVGWESLYAFSLPDWTVDWDRRFDGSTVGVPRVADGEVYVDGRGFLAALDPADGSTLWSREFPARTADDPGSVPTPSIVAVTPERLLTRGPAPDDGTTSREGLTAFSRADGSTLWHRAPERDGAYRYSSLAAAGDALYVAFFDGEIDEYRLLELVTATGELRDSATLDVKTPFEVVVGDGRLYVVGSSGIESRGG